MKVGDIVFFSHVQNKLGIVTVIESDLIRVVDRFGWLFVLNHSDRNLRIATDGEAMLWKLENA